ncbi:MAG: RHS repeat protein, partial [Clostridia bacterium]|nr:RHS repeat protein [Clostridia bacterium]
MENLPQVNAENNIVPLTGNIALLDSISPDTSEETSVKPKINFETTDELELPPKRYTAAEGGWVSSNEVDEEDMTETSNTASKGELTVVESGANAAGNSSVSSDVSYRISNINSKDSFALQNQTGRTNFIGDNIGEEYIDPMTGNLIVTETDLVLPGVDGLDLNLSRYYSLAQAELYTKTAAVKAETKTFKLPADMYVVTESVHNTETYQTTTYQYPYVKQDEAELRIEEIKSRDTCNGLYIYNADWNLSKEGDLITLDYYYTSDITATSYQRMRNNLGAGWSWSFPSVQVVKENYNDYDEFELPEAMYYHDGRGNVMEVEYDSLNGCYFTNHVGHDITFDILGYYDTSICSTARIDYMAEDSDCTKYYFGPHGEIRSIIDVYGNKIEFSYIYEDFYGAADVPIISSITDTVGRLISFRYTNDNDYEYIEVTVTSPLVGEDSIKLTYEKKMINVTCNDEYMSTEPFLDSVTYPNGDVTSYYPAMVNGERSYAQPTVFTFADKTFDSKLVLNTSGYANNLVYLLGNIVRPHSNTYYYYDLCERNLGYSGVSQAYRVWERGDDLLVTEDDNIIDGYSSNTVNFRYSRDYTGYPYHNSVDNAPDEGYICTTRELHENVTYAREFFKHEGAVLEQKETATYANPVGNDLSVTHNVESYFMKMPVMIKSAYSNGNNYAYDSYRYFDMSTYQNKTYGKPLLETEEMDYATAVSSDRKKHGMSYTYDSSTGFVLTRSWYKDSSTKCTERYSYDDKKRLSAHRMPDGTTTSYAYEYTNGKVSKKTTTAENDTGKTVIEENYTAATAYAYPSAVTKTVSQEDVTTSETTLYTYDMLLGVVKTVTDNEGNVTYYEYDKIGRPTRIIYPKYSTYSSYDKKDIVILPVEEIKYKTVRRGYDGVISSGELLRAQRIDDTVSYYDVSGISVSDPTALDLTTLSKTFYGAKTNYYLGTGELIESNTLDTVEGANAVNTKTYYYDTAANTIKEVDTKGNSIITQYDGAGREVKITDQFDNYRIMEYNISGGGVGFESLSYFVPSSDRNLKQNAVGYTYDRLGRTTSEKAYSDYPNISAEIKYVYDYAGNVIGITDANNNLNEDGYTQTNVYDRLNRIISSKNANNEIIKNLYDNAGNVKKQTLTDSNGNESILYQRSYDGEGKIAADTDNAGNSNLYSYDNMGRLVSAVDKDSKLHSYSYNETAKLDAQSHTKTENSIIARNYSYRNPHGANAVFAISGVYDEDKGIYTANVNETAYYSYSQTGKLLSKINDYAYSTGISGISFMPCCRYSYDSEGNVISAVYGAADNANQLILGATTFYEYSKNRISRVQIDGSSTRNTADSVNVQYEFYDDGKLKSVIFPTLADGSTLKSEYVYDGLSRLTSLTNYKGTEILSCYTYTYDSNGNILTTNETVGTVQNSTAYTYDKLNRISTVSGTKGADSYYEYDARGNRKANFEQIDFLQEENAEFRYNAEDKLCYAEVGADTTYIEYSENGYRYVKCENSSYPEFYIYDESGRLQAIAAPVYVTINGKRTIAMFPVIQYIWGPDRVLAQLDTTGNSYYYLYNGHGDVVQIVDTAG